MNTTHRVKIIESRLIRTFSPSFLEVVDESDQHIGHAGHQGGGRHFAIKITAQKFSNLSSVAAHRLIYGLFQDMIPEQIHALRIKIIK